MVSNLYKRGQSHTLLILLCVFFVVGLAGWLFLDYLTSEDADEIQEVDVTEILQLGIADINNERELIVSNVELCSMIDEDYNCVIRDNNVFERGDVVSIRSIVDGYTQNSINLVESITVYDSDIEKVDSLSETYAEFIEETTIYQQYSVKLRYDLVVKEWSVPGKYYLEVGITDINNGDFASKSIEFIVI